MALMCQASSSYYMLNEAIRSKAGDGMLCTAVNNIGTSQVKHSSKTTQSFNMNGSRIGSRRGLGVIIAASPPTEDVVVAAEPLTKEDLIGYLASGCKPKEKWKFNF